MTIPAIIISGMNNLMAESFQNSKYLNFLISMLNYLTIHLCRPIILMHTHAVTADPDLDLCRPAVSYIAYLNIDELDKYFGGTWRKALTMEKKQ
jgi:hypothetical protein